MLKMIKPKLTGSLHGPISAPKPAPNVLEALRRLINLLTEAGFTAGTSIAQTLLECDHNRVIAAGQSLLRTLSPLIGSRDPGDNPPADRQHRSTDHSASHDGSSSYTDQRFRQGAVHGIVPLCFSGVRRGLERFCRDSTDVARTKGRGSIAEET